MGSEHCGSWMPKIHIFSLWLRTEFSLLAEFCIWRFKTHIWSLEIGPLICWTNSCALKQAQPASKERLFCRDRAHTFWVRYKKSHKMIYCLGSSKLCNHFWQKKLHVQLTKMMMKIPNWNHVLETLSCWRNDLYDLCNLSTVEPLNDVAFICRAGVLQHGCLE